MRKKKVAYFYDSNYFNLLDKIGQYYYGEQHPMKPIRIKMAHQLIVNYGLYRKMDVYEPHWATADEITNFHSGEYINYIEKISKKSDPSSTVKQCKLISKIEFLN